MVNVISFWEVFKFVDRFLSLIVSTIGVLPVPRL